MAATTLHILEFGVYKDFEIKLIRTSINSDLRNWV